MFVMSAILLLIGWANALNLTVARFWSVDGSSDSVKLLVLRAVRLLFRDFLSPVS